ncbi:MAG: HAMP domain-containing sensor histidine kinase [Chloroflexi bacterium]|nr:HAMP domain-containing sensor histidine kinase [Chloroflexota bacterium]
MSNNQDRTDSALSDTLPSPGTPEIPGGGSSSLKNDFVRRTSLPISQLATLGASNQSTPVLQQNAVRTLRTELNVDAALIIDYANAFGTKTVRATSGIDSVLVGSEIWLPDWLTPVHVDSPVMIVNDEPGKLAAMTALTPDSEFRSALAVAVPGITGASGMIIALTEQVVEFSESQIESAKIIAGLLSMSASRTKLQTTFRRDEALLVAAHHISRISANGPDAYSSILRKIGVHLSQFFEIDVVALRTQIDGNFVTHGSVSLGHERQYEISDAGFDAVESRATTLRVAVSNTTFDSEHSGFSGRYVRRENSEIESTMALPVNAAATRVLVLGSARVRAYPADSVAIADRFVPALTAAFAGSDSVFSEPRFTGGRPHPKSDYLASIASATGLVPACGVIAAQITKRTGAARVQIGFIDEQSGRVQPGFDTQKPGDVLEQAWISTDEIEQLTRVDQADLSGPISRFSRVRIALKAVDRLIGFVEAMHGDEGFDEADVAEIREITTACAPVVTNLKQLEQARNTLERLELLNRVCDQIRLDETGVPLVNPRIASLVRNLFDADWLYFGTIDHKKDHVTAEIVDGLDVPELGVGASVSRRSLLVSSSSKSAPTGPVVIDIESAAPGQRAAGRWIYRAGLRSAIAVPLRVDRSVAAILMCASRKPARFGVLEKKMAERVVNELTSSAKNASQHGEAGEANSAASYELARLEPQLAAILTNTSVLVLTIGRNGIVETAEGRGIEGLKLVPERLLGRDFIKYSRKISGFDEPFRQALRGQSGRSEVEIFSTVLDVGMVPITSEKGVITAVSVVVNEITDRVSAARAESELRNLREEKRRASEFVMKLTHEMNNTLQVVSIISETLGSDVRGNLHPDQAQKLGIVEENIDRLTARVDDFSNISAMEAGTFDLEPSSFQVSEFAQELETSFGPVARGNDQTLAVTAPDEHYQALADREQLRIAVGNLLSNSSKYSPPGTTIALDIWIDDGDLRINVTDEGPGVPREERERIFDPFKRLKNKDVPGSGLGLTIVKQIVKLHNGTVWIEDGIGGGTTFSICLPGAIS